MRTVFLGAACAIALSACASAPDPAANFANLDRGESLGLAEGGRGAYSTWHAGPDRSEQATCVEPPAEAGPAGWRRFEACMAWFNGLTDRGAYQTRLGELAGD